MMPRIADLSAEEAANVSGEIFYNTGERKASLKLLYYAFTQDKNCPRALSVLTRALGHLTSNDIAAVISEYIYDVVVEEKTKSRIGFMRRMALDPLGLLTHPSTDLSGLSTSEWAHFWEHSPDFILDETRYEKIKRDVLQSHTLEEAFEAMLVFVGIRAGLVVPKVPKTECLDDIGFYDCFQPKNFRLVDDYSSFLAAESLTAEPTE